MLGAALKHGRSRHWRYLELRSTSSIDGKGPEEPVIIDTYCILCRISRKSMRNLKGRSGARFANRNGLE